MTVNIFSLASSYTDLTPSLNPQLPCHTLIVSSYTSFMDLYTASTTSPPTSGHTWTMSASPSSMSVFSSQVKKQLEVEPEGCRSRWCQPRALKTWAEQQCGILQHQERVPVLWKTSCLVPVPKNLTHLPSVTTDELPQTSHIMQVM